MIKYYLFLANSPLKRKMFEESVFSLTKERISIEYEADNKGYILADETMAVALQGCLFNIHDDLNVNITIVVAHKNGPLEEKLLREALSYFPNQCLYLTDMLMKELSFGDYSSLSLLSKEFKDIPHNLLLTVGTFLRCGLNGSLTADSLFIHRNTFNYRLNAFISLTGLDVRDYHNALLMEIFFQLGSPK